MSGPLDSYTLGLASTIVATAVATAAVAASASLAAKVARVSFGYMPQVCSAGSTRFFC